MHWWNGRRGRIGVGAVTAALVALLVTGCAGAGEVRTGGDTTAVPPTTTADPVPGAPAGTGPTATLRGSVPRCTPRAATAGGNVTFVNATSAPLEVVWLTFDCREQRYRTLAPGERYVQPTYAGHVWRTRRPGGAGVWGPRPVVPGETIGGRSGTGCADGLATTMTFVNAGAEPLDLFWLDTACRENRGPRLAPRQAAVLPTTNGQAWRVRSVPGEPRGAFTAAPGARLSFPT